MPASQQPTTPGFTFALFRWKGELERIPYLKSLLLLFLLTYCYAFAVHYLYLSFTLPVTVTPEMVFDAQRDNVLPVAVLFPMICLFALLDAKRLRNLNVHPVIALLANAISLIPKDTLSSAAQLIVLAIFIYRAALCILPPRTSPPHVLASNSKGKGVRIYAWHIRQPRPGATTSM